MDQLPALLYPAKSKTDQARMQSLKAKGLIRAIGPRLYASVPDADVTSAVRGEWAQIVSHLFPDALLSHRSALEYRPNEAGIITLTSTTNRKVEYPGLTLEFVRGPKALPSDLSFMGFHASSFARALLENLSVTKKNATRGMDPKQLEEKLEEFLRVKGETELKQTRDLARKIAEELGWSPEFERLNRMIGAMLGSKPITHLSGDLARARAIGKPFDPHCNERLELLFSELRTKPIADLPEASLSPDHLRNKAFFEAYFSNYIEGTTFEIEEAARIAFEREVPSARPKDAHDILGTYTLVSNQNEMRTCPTSPDHLISILKRRHEILMRERPEVSPGRFKTISNRTGDTHFVEPGLVEGTLERGFQKYLELAPGLARAIYIMFLVAEVHPFLDGNGRIARVMMNSELTMTGATTIIIPNVYRDHYIRALKALSRQGRADPLVRMAIRAQQFSAQNFESYPQILKNLQAQNWFREPDDALLIEKT